MTMPLNQTLLARASNAIGPKASLAVGGLILLALLAMPLLHLLPAD
ncbi:MAG TPA: urea ABC transporter permease subunit UrtC, partial [Pseudomonas sp.]|nr:urea ABC transporter permease subunit UrtC [Pseudomonas sp.]